MPYRRSSALIASGKHLQSDTYTTLGIILGLVLLYFIGLQWLDSAVALVFAFVIIMTGYKILRSSIAGIMDEADKQSLEDLVASLNRHREENWVDIHNLRIIMPWYLNIHKAHLEIDKIDKRVKERFGESVEMFVHTRTVFQRRFPEAAVGSFHGEENGAGIIFQIVKGNSSATRRRQRRMLSSDFVMIRVILFAKDIACGVVWNRSAHSRHLLPAKGGKDFDRQGN